MRDITTSPNTEKILASACYINTRGEGVSTCGKWARLHGGAYLFGKYHTLWYMYQLLPNGLYQEWIGSDYLIRSPYKYGYVGLAENTELVTSFSEQHDVAYGDLEWELQEIAEKSGLLLKI